MLLVCVYLDNLICMGSSLKITDKFRENMKKEFEMSDLGLMKYFLGLEVKHDEVGVHVSQKKYTDDLLRQYNVQGCNANVVPMSQSTKL